MAYVNKPVEVLGYDKAAYPFAAIVSHLLNVRRLDRLHEMMPPPDAILTRETDQSTWAHRRFYETVQGMSSTYRCFIEAVVEPFVGSSVVFQRIPTFRVHLPNNVAVGEFHRDTDYNHPGTAINFWLPLTEASSSSKVRIPSYDVPDLDVGQVLVFDGSLLHGNVLNETGKTRVSFDFRVIPKDKFVPRSDALTVNTKMPMDLSPSGYYDVLDNRGLWAL